MAGTAAGLLLSVHAVTRLEPYRGSTVNLSIGGLAGEANVAPGRTFAAQRRPVGL
jgi:hypothetical protein